MSGYKGKYQRGLEKCIAEGAPSLYINWINMSVREATSGGADRCTELLLAAGYRPEPNGIADKLQIRYVSGQKDDTGRYIRLPQETWNKEGLASCQS